MVSDSEIDIILSTPKRSKFTDESSEIIFIKNKKKFAF